MPRGFSKIVAFLMGGVLALAMNKLTWPDLPSLPLQQTASVTELVNNLHAGGSQPDRKAGDGVVGKGTYAYPHLEWKDADEVIESQKSIASSCQTRLLVLVISDARQQWKRDAVRDSWAVDASRYASMGVNKGDFKYVFILGRLFDQISDKVVQEAHKTKDIIVSDINDYDIDGGTNKTLWAMNWALKHCTFTHVLKTHDHAFVNVPLVVKQWLPRMDAGDFYAGLRLANSVPNRDPNGNWYISKEDYPHDKYPTYTRQDFVLSRDLVEAVAKVMNRTFTKLYYDDVAMGYTLATLKPQLAIQHEPNIIHMCTPAVSRPYVVLKVLEAVDMVKHGRDMFQNEIICRLSHK